ncbi:uncharacterized protein LOC114575174 [Exaiptasia diaphana]|uniref:Uncharacterized protein n=1 Tax=Exaiptasia diaphana TaxID=2652724 RepID=A0A913YM07_EXADI|nr:uncharacterized protein LOC114575174 [Exaiptasia diaphana]
MVLAQYAVDEEKGRHPSQTNCTNIYSVDDQLCSLWKELVQEGKITQEEFKQTTFSFYFRTVEQFKKPFNDPDSPVRRKSLELVSIATHFIPCEYKERWMRDKGDPKEHAKRYVASIRTWSNATLISGLADSRSAEKKSRIVDELYHRYESLVAKNPEDHGVDFVHAYIVIRKRQ